MAWLNVAAEIAAAAGGAFLDHLRARSEEEQRARDREAILDAIRQLGEALGDQQVAIELIQLRGELEGFQTTYGTYDPDPNDSAEENRLVALIDDSARVLGRLGQGIDQVNGNEQLALDSWPIYVALLYLRAQAMTERQVTYGAKETADALPSFDVAIPRLEELLAYLRRQSDARFGEIVCGTVSDMPGVSVCWYIYGNSRIICGRLDNPNAIEMCTEGRERVMRGAYGVYPGVRELGAALAQLRDAREELSTVGIFNFLEEAGASVWDDVVIEENRFQIPLTTPRDRTKWLLSG